MNTMTITVAFSVRLRGEQKDQENGRRLSGTGSAAWRRAIATPAQISAAGSSLGLLTTVTCISARSRSCVKRTTTSPTGVGRRTVPPRRSESRSSAYSPLPASCMRTNAASVTPEKTCDLDTCFGPASAELRQHCIPSIGGVVGFDAATARPRRDGFAGLARDLGGIGAESRRAV